MTIHWYLIIACILLFIIVIVSFAYSREKKIDKDETSIWVWCTILVILLGALSPFVVKKYLFPTDTAVFNNSDYHIFEHTGFNVSSPFYLVSSEEKQVESLYDSKEGDVHLYCNNDGGVTIEANNFYEPIFVKNANDETTHLANRYIETDVRNGFKLSLNGNDIYILEIVPQDKGKCLYISTLPDRNQKDTSEFTKTIKVGYMLSQIMSATPGLEISEELGAILEGTMLVREFADDTASDLVFMPNQLMGLNSDIKINGERVLSEKIFKEKLENGAEIHTGFGFQKTKDIKLSRISDSQISLRYIIPVRKKLRNTDSKLLITSSIDVAAENTDDGVYLFNIFDEENNLNNINGTIEYSVADSRTDMLFRVHDMKAFSDEISDTVIGCDTEFCLQTSGSNSTAPCEWTFQIHNMRETNKLTYNYIILIFVGLFLFWVCVRVFTDQWFCEKKKIKSSLSGFEIGTYIALLAFGVTRLILQWRMSTFPPIDDNIGINAFDKMTDSYFWFTAVSCHIVPLLMTIWSICTAMKIHENRNILKKIKFSKNKYHIFIIFGYGLMWCGLYLLRGLPYCERFFVIFFPILLYFLADFWLMQLLLDKRKGENAKEVWLVYKIRNLGWERPLLFLIATLGFFKSDAGFAVLFVTFSLVRLAVTIFTEDNEKLMRLPRILGFIFILVITFAFIINEGWFMKVSINNLKIILPVAILIISGIFIAISIIVKVNRKAIIVIAVLGILLALGSECSIVQNKIIERGIHMKYRSEVQELKKDQDIGDLMTECKFKSTDVEFIMRSALNQWFLNQYLNAGDSLDGYFRLQPHSNQGSPYNTQTTDVAITRYVIAEHSGPIAELMILMFLLLIAIYCCEVDVTGRNDGRSRGFMAMLIFLFTTAFSVYMSATNRSVFMGQDFPFISLGSRLAVILPSTIMFLVAQHVMLIYGERRTNTPCGKRNLSPNSDKNIDGTNDSWTSWFIPVSLIIFALIGWKGVPSKGAEQNINQFNVNKIINEVTVNTERIDDAFALYQEQNMLSLRGKDLNEVWKSFTSESKEWKTIADTTNNGNVSTFIPSLMNDFNMRTSKEKCNPDGLIHIRKRQHSDNNGRHWYSYRLCVNKKFYFIPGIIDRSTPWTGNLLAAETPLFFSFRSTNNPRFVRTTIKNKNNVDYETNIIPNAQRSTISNVQIMRFDTSWVDDGKPLLLIKTIPNDKQYYDIDSKNHVVNGRGSHGQMATRIQENDIISINEKEGRKTKNLFKQKYGLDNHRYLAKNVWINGRQQLFYPLGKESMWSYQFANLVNNVYGNDSISGNSYRDRSLRVSIDYDLHKEFYRIMKEKNRGAIAMSDQVRDNLSELINEDYSVKISSQSNYYLYFDIGSNSFKPNKKVVPTNRLEETTRLANIANKKLTVFRRRGYIFDDITITEVLSEITKHKYSYSAVVLDGNGRIRLLFDYNKQGQRIDPNNITHYNKFISDMYRNGSNELERDILGNKNLQHLNPGPGSTFKPIVYTAITSTKKINWNSIDVSPITPANVVYTENDQNNNNRRYNWYGGVSAQTCDIPYYSIDGSSGYAHNDYIIQSNNFYHSVIVLLGLQQSNNMESIIGPAVSGEKGFPQFSYNGSNHSFDPQEWYYRNSEGNSIELGNTIMEEGLRNNFGLNIDYNSDKYYNAFGNDTSFRILFDQTLYSRQWCYPETGSLNRYLRQCQPWVRQAFVQMVSGSSPLNVTPLQVATMAMRLATLNGTDNITTLNDAVNLPPKTDEFDVTSGGWESNEEYFNFYKEQVLGQMRKVPTIGTAKILSSFAQKLSRRGYYLYAKTGTLNIDGSKKERMRNLMVIIANGELDKAENLSALRSIRYYVIYMSYRNVPDKGFSNKEFLSQIEAVVNSELFNQYMQEGK